MINVTFPDGAERAYESGVSAFDIARSISPSLAKLLSSSVTMRRMCSPKRCSRSGPAPR
jgi:hypothetical protein